MRARKKSETQVDGTLTVEPRGGFTHAGSWREDMPRHPKGHVHRLVDELVRGRRAGTLRLELAANAIEAASAQHAFPNVAQWRVAPGWAFAQCSTSAEQAVVYEGRGVDGHWCGERFMPGSELNCSDERHRQLPRVSEVQSLLSVVMAGLPNVPRESFGPAYAQPGPAPDEAYFRRLQERERREGK